VGELEAWYRPVAPDGAGGHGEAVLGVGGVQNDLDRIVLAGFASFFAI